MKNALLVLSSIAFAASPLAAQVVYTGGHGDLGIALEDGTDFYFHAHFHAGAVVDGSPLLDDAEFDVSDVTVVVPLSTLLTVPFDLPAAGAESGDSIWVLPQSNPGTDDIPFFGFATEEIDADDWAGPITFSLTNVSSPSGDGDFSLWQSGGLGALDFYFSTVDPTLTVNGDNSVVMSAGGHDHYNWGFSEAGLWELELTVSGTHNTLGFLSDVQTISFSVVPEPSTTAALIGGAIFLLVAFRRRLRAA